jgi:hypothetical protein
MTADWHSTTRPSACTSHRRWFVRPLLVLLIAGAAWGPAATGETAEAEANAIEAAMLRNFARYVLWPPAVFSNDHSPWRVCILGPDPFGKTLDETLRGRTEQGRGFEITRTQDTDLPHACHIVFVAYADEAKRRAALSALRRQPALTVSEAPGFLEEGGIIRFEVSDRVEMGVNLDQARISSLRIPTKLLEVSRDVLDNGTLRRRR